MAKLAWDEVGERRFETGVSRGVLYQASGWGIAWNGLTSIDEDISTDVEPIYFDGVKINDIVTIGDFKANLKAFTYPDEFLFYEGSIEDSVGFYITSQPTTKFGLAYRTEVGNDLEQEAGYKIHLLYNLTAVPSQTSYKTLTLDAEPVEFEWTITSIPEHLSGFRPTAHVILDSRIMNPYLLADIEDILYGQGHSALAITDNGDGTWTASSTTPGVITMTDDTTFSIETDTAEYLDADTYIISSDDKNAFLPTLQALSAFIKSWRRLIVIDNGDGTWTASSSVPGVITMLDDTKFLIESDTAVYLDSDTYEISSSEENEGDIWLPRP